MSTSAKKTIERTYDIDTEGAPFGPLTSAQKAGLTTRLRADAKKEGLGELGETRFGSRSGTIGGVFKVTVSATEEATRE